MNKCPALAVAEGWLLLDISLSVLFFVLTGPVDM